jgi:hypothetical protein
MDEQQQYTTLIILSMDFLLFLYKCTFWNSRHKEPDGHDSNYKISIVAQILLIHLYFLELTPVVWSKAVDVAVDIFCRWCKS